MYSAFDLVSSKGNFDYLEKFCFLLRLHSIIASFHEDRPNKAQQILPNILSNMSTTNVVDMFILSVAVVNTISLNAESNTTVE